MSAATATVAIQSRDYWVKIVEMLQQNWALVDDVENGAVVYFVDDRSGVFDRITFASDELATKALRRNGFVRFDEDLSLAQFLAPPRPPFHESQHDNGSIYSSGRFWI